MTLLKTKQYSYLSDKRIVVHQSAVSSTPFQLTPNFKMLYHDAHIMEAFITYINTIDPTNKLISYNLQRVIGSMFFKNEFIKNKPDGTKVKLTKALLLQSVKETNIKLQLEEKKINGVPLIDLILLALTDLQEKYGTRTDLDFKYSRILSEDFISNISRLQGLVLNAFKSLSKSYNTNMAMILPVLRTAMNKNYILTHTPEEIRDVDNYILNATGDITHTVQTNDTGEKYYVPIEAILYPTDRTTNEDYEIQKSIVDDLINFLGKKRIDTEHGVNYERTNESILLGDLTYINKEHYNRTKRINSARRSKEKAARLNLKRYHALNKEYALEPGFDKDYFRLTSRPKKFVPTRFGNIDYTKFDHTASEALHKIYLQIFASDQFKVKQQEEQRLIEQIKALLRMKNPQKDKVYNDN